jgi:hypothetical protein
MLNQLHTHSSDTVATAVGDETVLLQLATGQYYGLDLVGTRIWALLGGECDPVAICIQLQAEYDVAPAVVEADVNRIVAELETNQLIDVAPIAKV